MKTKYYITIIIAIISLQTHCLFANDILIADTNFVDAGDKILLKLDRYDGDVLWKKSYDGISWGYLFNLDPQKLQHVIDSSSYYCAEIKVDECNTLYTDTSFFFIDSQSPIGEIEIKEILAHENYISIEFTKDLVDPYKNYSSSMELVITNYHSVVNIHVTSFELDDIKDNVLICKLSDMLYESDSVFVTYNAAIGNLESVHGTRVETFNNVYAEFSGGPNLFEFGDFDYSFENTVTANWRSAGWGWPYGGSYISIVDDMAYHGVNSAYFNIPADSCMASLQFMSVDTTEVSEDYFAKFYLEAGIYTLESDIYVETIGEMPANKYEPDIRFYLFPVNHEIIVEIFEDGEFVDGEWKHNKNRFSVPDDDFYYIVIRGFNDENPEPLKFYLDNLQVRENTTRP